MLLKKWENIPEEMKNINVKEYYNILQSRKISLVIKRLFDIIVSFIMLVVLLPVMLILSIIIKCDSKGPVMFRQTRVTQYGRRFKIYKFRTMVANAEKIGTQVTTMNDSRVTRVGKLIRGCRLDELPQLINILVGDMTFVGTRPEVVKYVEQYSEEMMATLLLPAGVTSEASIEYKNEDMLLSKAENVDEVYVNRVLPDKMVYNLAYLKKFGFFTDIKLMLRTVIAVIR